MKDAVGVLIDCTFKVGFDATCQHFNPLHIWKYTVMPIFHFSFGKVHTHASRETASKWESF